MKKKLQGNVLTYLIVLFVGALLMEELVEIIVDFTHGFIMGMTGTEYVPGNTISNMPLAKVIIWGISVGIVLLVYIILKKRINAPVKKLSEGMQRVQEGDLNVEIEVTDGFEFRQMEEDFNSMVKGLREARNYQEEMAEKNRELYAEIAHDLKTPMTMILGYAKILNEGAVSEDKQKEYLSTITEQTQNANALLEQMLEYAKLGSTEYKLEMKESDLAELLRLVVSDSYLRFEEKHMTLDIEIPDEPVLCSIDERQMKRVFFNLIGNVINHNPEGTAVKIGLSVIEGTEGARIYIADNGPLISPELKDSLFDPFKTGDESRSKHGSGLGLSVAKKIVELHDGTLEYQENIFQGYKGFVIAL